MYAVNLLAMHYDEMGQRAADGGAKEFGKALELIEEAISMDASCVELHLNKASFLAHAGDLQGAADAAETSRKLDLADRFLNSNCVGHMMRAGRYACAEELAAMFARDGDPATNLFDMRRRGSSSRRPSATLAETSSGARSSITTPFSRTLISSSRTSSISTRIACDERPSMRIWIC